MELIIGVKGASRELNIEVGDDAKERAEAVIAAAINGDQALDLTDVKGTRFLVPARALAYVQVGATTARRVGFGV